jgi:hypothetical protein
VFLIGVWQNDEGPAEYAGIPVIFPPELEIPAMAAMVKNERLSDNLNKRGFKSY